MAEDYNSLKERFEGIRDERGLQRNTATRIGRAFLDLLDYLRSNVDGKFISKINNDTANGFITFVSGLVSNALAWFKQGIKIGSDANSPLGIDASGNATLNNVTAAQLIASVLKTPGFAEAVGLAGKGFGVTAGQDGRATLQTDDLIVLGRMLVNSLNVREVTYIGGVYLLTLAGSTVAAVQQLYAEGGSESDTRTWSTDNSGMTAPVVVGYRLYWLADNGTTATMNFWQQGDQAYCQTFNIEAGVHENVSNSLWWRLVVGVGTDDSDPLGDGKDYHYADVADTDIVLLFDSKGEPVTGDGGSLSFIGKGSSYAFVQNRLNSYTAPVVGDKAVCLGSQTSSNRRGAIQLNTEDEASIGIYDGINNFANLSTHEVHFLSKSEVRMSSRRFRWTTATGASTPPIIYRGDWTKGSTSYYYDEWDFEGSRWLCLYQGSEGTTEAPGTTPANWKEISLKGDAGTGYKLLPNPNIIKTKQTGESTYDPATASLTCGYVKNVGGTITSVANATAVIDDKYCIYFRRKSRGGDYESKYWFYTDSKARAFLSSLSLSGYDAAEFYLAENSLTPSLDIVTRATFLNSLSGVIDNIIVPVVADGESGTSPWTADNYNEMDSIACDANGKPVQINGNDQSVSTVLKVWHGSTEESFSVTSVKRNSTEVTLGSKTSGVTVTWDGTNKVLTVTYDSAANTQAVINGKDEYEIAISANNGNFTPTLNFTVNGVRPGADGEAAVLYNLLPSVNAISFGEGSLEQSFYMQVLKTEGDSSNTIAMNTLSEMEVHYSTNTLPDESNPQTQWGTVEQGVSGIGFSGTANNTATIQPDVEFNQIYLALFKTAGSGNNKTYTLIDRETIPIVRDGAKGDNAQYIYLKGTAHDTADEIHTTINPEVSINGGSNLAGNLRGLNLVTINRQTLALVESINYDTYGEATSVSGRTGLTDLYAKLTALDNSVFVCLVSYDAIGWNSNLITMLQSYGMGDLPYTDAGRYPFLFIGYKNLGKGNGLTRMRGTGNYYDVVELSAYVANGALTLKDGNNGDTIKTVTVYKRSDTQPETPTGSTIPPMGWSTSVPVIGDFSDVVWSSMATFKNDILQGSWSTPVRWNGQNGDDGYSVTLTPSTIIINQSEELTTVGGVKDYYLDYTNATAILEVKKGGVLVDASITRSTDGTCSVPTITRQSTGRYLITMGAVNKHSGNTYVDPADGATRTRYYDKGRITINVTPDGVSEATTLYLDFRCNLQGTINTIVKGDVETTVAEKITYGYNNETGSVGSLQAVGKYIRSSEKNIAQLTETVGSTNYGNNLFGFSKGVSYNGIRFVQGYGFVTNLGSNTQFGMGRLGVNAQTGYYVVTCEAKMLSAARNITFAFWAYGDVLQTRSIGTNWKKLTMVFRINSFPDAVDAKAGYFYSDGVYDGEHWTNPLTDSNRLAVRYLQIERGSVPSAFGICAEDAQSLLQEPITSEFVTASEGAIFDNDPNNDLNGLKHFQNRKTYISAPAYWQAIGNTRYINIVEGNGGSVYNVESGCVYTLSFWAKGSINGMSIHSYLYAASGQTPIIDNFDGVDADNDDNTGRINVDGNTETFLTTSWKKYYIHWYIDKATGPRTLIVARLEGYTNADEGTRNSQNLQGVAFICGVRFDKGYVTSANRTEYQTVMRQTARRMDFSVLVNSMEKAGIHLYTESNGTPDNEAELAKGIIELNADNVRVSNDLTVKRLLTDENKSNPHVEIFGSSALFFGKKGQANIVLSVDGNDCAQLNFFDNDGNFKYGLGPSTIFDNMAVREDTWSQWFGLALFTDYGNEYSAVRVHNLAAAQTASYFKFVEGSKQIGSDIIYNKSGNNSPSQYNDKVYSQQTLDIAYFIGIGYYLGEAVPQVSLVDLERGEQLYSRIVYQVEDTPTAGAGSAPKMIGAYWYRMTNGNPITARLADSQGNLLNCSTNDNMSVYMITLQQ